MKSIAIVILLFVTGPLYAQENVRPKVKSLVNKMADYKRIDSEAVGYAAERTKQYDRFIRLTKIATTDELVLLTDHESPVVRGYSFWALAKRNYEDLAKILDAHTNDTTAVDHLIGCFGGEIPLIGFMKQVVTPNVLDMNCKKLIN